MLRSVWRQLSAVGIGVKKKEENKFVWMLNKNTCLEERDKERQMERGGVVSVVILLLGEKPKQHLVIRIGGEFILKCHLQIFSLFCCKHPL